MTVGGRRDEHRVVRVWGHDIRVVVRRSTTHANRAEERPVPLVLCNGIGASLDLLAPFVDALDPSIEVVRFDVPGVGGSPAPACPTTSRSSPRASVACSTCSSTAASTCSASPGAAGSPSSSPFHNPRRCRRAVLVSTGTGSIMVPGHPRVLSRMVTPRRWRDPEYALHVAATLYGGQVRDNPGLVREVVHGHARVGSRRGYLLQLLAGVGWSSLPGLPLLRQRTLVLAGDDDPIIPLVNARLMAALIPQARLHVFSDGHLGLVTQADLLGPVVSSFLAEED